MVAITTKYLGPTNTKGSRIKASAGRGREVTISYDHALGQEACHAKAARALMTKMGWPNKLVAGGLKNGGYVFVMIPLGAETVGLELW